jgi:hypothetical protein
LTVGNRILRADTMSPIILRGVNRSGLEYSEPSGEGFLAAAGMSQNEIHMIVGDWGANVVRIPFNQDWCLNGRGVFSAETYLSSLDRIVAWASALGAYTILDLQWLDVETAYGNLHHPVLGRTVNHVPPAPNEQTILLWQMLAERYQNEPAVLFDLLNEPHDPLKDDPHPLHVISADGRVVESDRRILSSHDWARWATLLATEIRRIKPGGIILVSGIDWGFDLSEIKIDAPDIVYSAHIYSNRHRFVWRRAIGRSRKVPIFVGEWGGTEDDLTFGKTLAAKMRALGLGWTAWSWSDFPHLVSSAQTGDHTPSLFGALVRNELAFPVS